MNRETHHKWWATLAEGGIEVVHALAGGRGCCAEDVVKSRGLTEWQLTQDLICDGASRLIELLFEMGPNLIFDKSFLQSLTVDESVWLDAFYTTVITPIFYVETLADIEKSQSRKGNPIDFVKKLAEKTPDNDVFPCGLHSTIMYGELTGQQEVDMTTGRPIVLGGRMITLGDQSGAFLKESDESVALNRWRNGEFLDLERQEARHWRESLLRLSTEKQKSLLSPMFTARKPQSLNEILDLAQNVLEDFDKKSMFPRMVEGFGFSIQSQERIVKRWENDGKPRFGVFAPYAYFVTLLETFYFFVSATELVSQRPTNSIDLSYLFYLPFCNVFVSSDDFHKKVAPLFLRPNQSFVWGWEMKQDLGKLDVHFSSFPQAMKDRGIMYFATTPPRDEDFLSTRLWDQHMRKDWREVIPSVNTVMDRPADPKLMEMFKSIEAAADNIVGDTKNTARINDFIVTTHPIRRIKGKWRRLPPNL